MSGWACGGLGRGPPRTASQLKLLAEVTGAHQKAQQRAAAAAGTAAAPPAKEKKPKAPTLRQAGHSAGARMNSGTCTVG